MMKISKKVINILIALACVIGINYYFFNDLILGRHSIFNFFFLVIFYLFLNMEIKSKKEEVFWAYLYGFFVGLSLVIGSKIFLYNDIMVLFNFKQLLVSLIMVYGFTNLIGKLTLWLWKKIEKIKPIKAWKVWNVKGIFFLLWLIIFLSFIPAFLAYYPGILSYDAPVQILEATGVWGHGTLQPPIHTFIFTLCLKLGAKINIEPTIIYSIPQMLFLAFVYAKLIKTLIDKKVNNYLILLALVFIIFNPVVSIFSLLMTKDIYFTGLLILFILELVKFTFDTDYLDKWYNWVKIFILVLLISLFRSNAIYIFIVFIPLVLLVLKKNYIKITSMMVLPIIAYFLIVKLLYPALNIGNNSTQEKFSVPVMQIAYVVNRHEDNLTPDTKNKINEYLDYEVIKDENKYNYRYADYIKGSFKTKNYEKDKMGFYKLWFNLLKKYPADYVSAFLTLNLPYWYIDSDAIDPYALRVYIETGLASSENYPVTRRSKAPRLLDYYEKVASYELFDRIPLIATIFGISLPLWLLLFATFKFFADKEYFKFLIIAPLLLLLLTYFLGPVSNFRYIFPIFTMYPFIIALLFKNANK